MIHPIPPGTRDILPDEMRELRALQATLIEVFERFGYGQVATPTLEYDEVLQRGEGRSGVGAYRFFDERGELLALRSDMTIPIARLVATRFADAQPPHRFSYTGNAYRIVRPQRGQVRQFLHAGIELLGSPAPEGTAEVLEVLTASLDAVGLNRAVLGLGDADLFRQLLTELGVEGEQRARILDRLAEHNLVGLEVAVDEVEGLDAHGRETLLRLPGLRGGAEVLEEARELGGAAVERAAQRLQQTYDLLVEKGVAGRVQLDLSLLRDLGYYTGAIVEIYDPALGHILGGGGRYDDLVGRFGRPMPAAGFGLYLERVHLAQMEEERLTTGGREMNPTVEAPRARVGGPLKLAIPRGALWGETLDALDRIGVDTAEMHGDSRSLIFEVNGMSLVTMRPSDVPTYVESGAADLGITGKDVLLEHTDRIVYEILDLGYGACRMVLAGRKDDESLGEAERRLGGMRIATKYPRIAERYFEETGRQAEVIEVKGSVELAPLVGLADGIVDLVATGRTLEENGLEIREQIASSTARLVANRVSHKLRAVEVDDLVERLRPEKG